MVSGTKILHSVNAAFRFIDDFTGKPLKEQPFIFFVRGKRLSPVRKPEGLYILTDIAGSGNNSLMISSPGYCDFSVPDLSGIGRENPVLTVRLKPGTDYPLKKGCTAFSACFTGRGGSGIRGLVVRLHAPYLKGGIRFKGLQETGQTCRISLTNPNGLDYTGLTLALAAEGRAEAPFVFTLLRRLDGASYEIRERPVAEIAPSSPARRVYSSETDASGRVLIPVFPDGEGGEALLEADLYVSDGFSSCSRRIRLREGLVSNFNGIFPPPVSEDPAQVINI